MEQSVFNLSSFHDKKDQLKMNEMGEFKMNFDTAVFKIQKFFKNILKIKKLKKVSTVKSSFQKKSY